MDHLSAPSNSTSRVVRRRTETASSRRQAQVQNEWKGPDYAPSGPAHLSSHDKERIEELESMLNGRDASLADVDDIDHELKYLESITLRLRARRNACQLVARLPTEMLTEIFYFVAAVCQPHRPFVRTFDRVVVVADPGRGRSDLGWVKLAHVCRRWREIILQLPTLWARAVCSLVGAEDVLLQRARCVPLTLSLNAHHHRLDEKTVNFVKSNIDRAGEIEVREVLLHPHPAAWPAGVRALAGRSLPMLESLCLDLKPSRKHNISADVFHLPPLNAPRLKRLELTNFFVPLRPTPNLTELILSRCDFQNMSTVPPPEVLLDLLANCPLLRKLHLLGWIPDVPRFSGGPDDPSYAEEVVPLMHIEDLSLTSTTRRLTSFWSRIRIPSTADVRLRLDPAHLDMLHHPQHDPERYELMRTIGPHFTPAFAPDAPRRIVGVSIFDFPDEESLRFCLFTREPGQENAGQEAQWTGPFARDYAFRLDVQCYRWEMSAGHFISMLRHIFDAFDFGTMQTLEIMSHYPGEAVEWQRTLARVTSPAELSLDGMPNRELMHALGAPMLGALLRDPEPDAQGQSQGQPHLPGPAVLFPNMHTLYLSASTEHEWLQSPTAQADVLDMLQYRDSAGAPVRRLVLDERSLPTIPADAGSILSMLRKAVDVVELKREKCIPRNTHTPHAFMPWDGAPFMMPMMGPII